MGQRKTLGDAEKNMRLEMDAAVIYENALKCWRSVISICGCRQIAIGRPQGTDAMETEKVKESDIDTIHSHYETASAVSTLSMWYDNCKERAFSKYLFARLKLPQEGPVVEIGGGSGVQGLIFRENFANRYLHTDYSKALVAKAQEFGHRSEVMDGLAMPFADGSVAFLILISPTTIIRDADMRRRQFAECSRVLADGGAAVFVTSRLAWRRGHHCLDRRDVVTMKEFGLELERYESWGGIPGRYWKTWNCSILSAMEACICGLNLGVRRVVVVRKN